jgi:hypothetical protein
MPPNVSALEVRNKGRSKGRPSLKCRFLLSSPVNPYKYLISLKIHKIIMHPRIMSCLVEVRTKSICKIHTLLFLNLPISCVVYSCKRNTQSRGDKMVWTKLQRIWQTLDKKFFHVLHAIKFSLNTNKIMVNDAKDIEENIGTRKLHYPQSSMLINHLLLLWII